MIPGLERSSGEGKGYSLQSSGLENSTDCRIHGVAKSWTWLSLFTFLWLHFCWGFLSLVQVEFSQILSLQVLRWSWLFTLLYLLNYIGGFSVIISLLSINRTYLLVPFKYHLTIMCSVFNILLKYCIASVLLKMYTFMIVRHSVVYFLQCFCLAWYQDTADFVNWMEKCYSDILNSFHLYYCFLTL